MNEASRRTATPVVDRTALELVARAARRCDDLAAVVATLDALLADLATGRAEHRRRHRRPASTTSPTLLARAARVRACRRPAGGSPTTSSAAPSRRCSRSAPTWSTRWDDRLAEFGEAGRGHAPPPTAEETVPAALPGRAAISTEVTVAAAGHPGGVRDRCSTASGRRSQAAQTQFADVADTTRPTVAGLLADVAAAAGCRHRSTPRRSPSPPHEDEMVRFARGRRARWRPLVRAELDRRGRPAQDLFDDARRVIGAGRPTGRARGGRARRCSARTSGSFPSSRSAAAQGDELAKAVAASTDGRPVRPPRHAARPGRLPGRRRGCYGVARVREKLRAWEERGDGRRARSAAGEPDLVAAAAAVRRRRPLARPASSLPTWSSTATGCSTPRTSRRRSTRPQPQCGLLLDEWTETIPGPSVDTGIAFHHDRPNTEAPQAMLLVTPTDFRGAWQWDDLVDALNETLDLAKRRAVEPEHIDASPYAPFLPATVAGHPGAPADHRGRPRLNNKIAVAGGADVAALPHRRPRQRRARAHAGPGITVWNRLEGRPRADELRPRAARRGARPAVDADPAVADGGVPRRRRRLADRRSRCGSRRPGCASTSPPTGRSRRSTTRSRSRRTSSGCRCGSPSAPATTTAARHGARPAAAARAAVAEDDRRRRAGRRRGRVRRRVPRARARPDRAARRRRPPRTPRRGPASPRSRAGRWTAPRCYDHLLDVAGQPRLRRHRRRSPGMDAVIDPIAERFVAWFERLVLPARRSGRAWLPDRLEYRFAASAPTAGDGAARRCWSPRSTSTATSTGTTSTSTPTGPCSARRTRPRRRPSATTLTMLPTQVDVQRDAEHAVVGVRGRPHQLRRRQAGHHRPGQAAADRVRARLRQRLVPGAVHRCPPGTHRTSQGMAVTNVFGERTWVEAAGRGDDEDWQRWAMFLLSTKGEAHVPADLSLLLPPDRAEGARGPAARGGAARSATRWPTWSGAIERTIPLPTGRAARRPRGGVRDPRLLRARARAPARRSTRAAAARRGRQDPLPGDEHGARALDPDDARCTSTATTARSSCSRGAMLRIMDGDPAPSPPGPAAHVAAAPGPRGDPEVGYVLARGGGPARRRPRDPVLPAHPLDATAAPGCGSACASRPAAARGRAAWRSTGWWTCRRRRPELIGTGPTWWGKPTGCGMTHS